MRILILGLKNSPRAIEEKQKYSFVEIGGNGKKQTIPRLKPRAIQEKQKYSLVEIGGNGKKTNNPRLKPRAIQEKQKYLKQLTQLKQFK